MNQLGNKLTQLRKKANLTQQDLALQINYSDKVISKWERGESLPDIEALNILSKFYRITIDDIVNKTEIDTDYIPKPIYIKQEAEPTKIINTEERVKSKNFVPLIMGIASILIPFIGLIFGIIGIINGKIYMRKEKSTLVSVGYALSIIGVILALVVIIALMLFTSVKDFSGDSIQDSYVKLMRF